MLRPKSLLILGGAGLAAFIFWGSSPSVVGCFASCVIPGIQGNRNERAVKRAEADNAPVACNLNAFDAEQRRRHQSLTLELLAAVQQSGELEDGYSFRLPGDEATIRKITEWVMLERRCCPFISFGLEIGDEGQPVLLNLTGKQNVKALLKSAFGVK